MRRMHLILALLLAAVILAAPAAAVGESTATISVTSSPSGAAVYDAGSYQGLTPCAITVYTTGTPVSHTIVISKDGYYDYHEYIGVLRTDEYVSVNAVLTPTVQTGYLSLSSTPSGANVYVDGSYEGTTPLTASVDTGTHSVRVEKPGYNTWYGTYSVSSGQTTSVSAELVSAVSYGYISVRSSPSGANIYVDGNYRDSTPETISVTAETHQVRVVLSGYEVYTQTVNVGSGSTAYIDAKLQSSSDAYMRIASYPAGAAMYLDGTYCGNTGYSSATSVNYMDVGPLSAGTHAIMLKKEGYNTYTSSVTLAANEIRTMSVTLVPTGPTPAGYAGLHLASTPSGASVYVDNVFRGYTPLYLSDIPAGSHTVLLQHTGYHDWTEYMTFTEGYTVEKDVSMSASGAPPAPTKSPFPALAFAGLFGVAAVALRRTI